MIKPAAGFGYLICIYILRPEQDVNHFADNIFKLISSNESVWFSIPIPMAILNTNTLKVPWDLLGCNLGWRNYVAKDKWDIMITKENPKNARFEEERKTYSA